MKTLLSFAILGTVLLFPSAGLADSASTIYVGVADYPPYASQEGIQREDGSVGKGVDVDFTKAVLKHANYQAQITFYPLTRLEHALFKGNTPRIDISPSFFFRPSVTGERQIVYDMGGFTLLYKRADDTRQVGALFESGATDMIISLVRGKLYGDAFEKAMSHSRFSEFKVLTDKKALMMLLKNRADLAAVNAGTGEYLIKSLGLSKQVSLLEQTYPYGEDIKTSGAHFVIGQHMPDDFADEIQQSAKALLKQGVFTDIILAYGFEQMAKRQQHYQDRVIQVLEQKSVATAQR